MTDFVPRVIPLGDPPSGPAGVVPLDGGGILPKLGPALPALPALPSLDQLRDIKIKITAFDPEAFGVSMKNDLVQQVVTGAEKARDRPIDVPGWQRVAILAGGILAGAAFILTGAAIMAGGGGGGSEPQTAAPEPQEKEPPQVIIQEAPEPAPATATARATARASATARPKRPRKKQEKKHVQGSKRKRHGKPTTEQKASPNGH